MVSAEVFHRRTGGVDINTQSSTKTSAATATKETAGVGSGRGWEDEAAFQISPRRRSTVVQLDGGENAIATGRRSENIQCRTNDRRVGSARHCLYRQRAERSPVKQQHNVGQLGFTTLFVTLLCTPPPPVTFPPAAASSLPTCGRVHVKAKRRSDAAGD